MLERLDSAWNDPKLCIKSQSGRERNTRCEVEWDVHDQTWLRGNLEVNTETRSSYGTFMVRRRRAGAYTGRKVDSDVRGQAQGSLE